uniref:Uncharacterized protein n=1 Tax=Rhizophora mucronata TaxID=61149 RepID=A0A2P2QPU6_RHIMU
MHQRKTLRLLDRPCHSHLSHHGTVGCHHVPWDQVESTLCLQEVFGSFSV